MKKIGEGWQYSVYDMDNGRVLKKFHAPVKIHWVIFKSLCYSRIHHVYKVFKYSNRMKKQARESLLFIFKKDINLNFFGNPKQIKGIDYEQDKVVPLSKHIQKLDIEDQKKLIDEFVSFNKKLIKNGFVDKNFNFGKNFGIDAMGKIVLIDLGEIIIGRDKIKKQIEKRTWSHKYVMETIPKQVADYFIQKMDDSLFLS